MQYFDELDSKPFDRAVLDRFAASVKGRGRVCDLACSPGTSRVMWPAGLGTS